MSPDPQQLSLRGRERTSVPVCSGKARTTTKTVTLCRPFFLYGLQCPPPANPPGFAAKPYIHAAGSPPVSLGQGMAAGEFHRQESFTTLGDLLVLLLSVLSHSVLQEGFLSVQPDALTSVLIVLIDVGLPGGGGVRWFKHTGAVTPLPLQVLLSDLCFQAQSKKQQQGRQQQQQQQRPRLSSAP